MTTTPQQQRTPAHAVLELSSDGEDDERLRLALDGFETYVYLVIDGAYYGALSIRPHPARHGWQLELGQYSQVTQDWARRNPIGRLGGWIECGDNGYYAVIDGAPAFTEDGGWPIAFDTAQEAHVSLVTALRQLGRDYTSVVHTDVIDLRRGEERDDPAGDVPLNL
ncbi:hypothetical protein [Gordonia sp. SMJS1]|uniref:hypothetical protein n=1 Tax=Gordonia sp. SMJS1 TaxID=3039400 RepID=UPI0024551CFD|nr:hypothetical protein [Gordonia sp. SMJS1]WGJ88288.1 hypothetical protein QAD21_25235 [Gordonia sp. SMJS1]